ncbi:hypothetical protein GHK33_01240 [Sinorhizobium meliloti]|nr:hypothetical protein [Sinorhizobium meliloti]MDX0323117.1 hypothetical protein [Sinorhizobium meliloti]MQW61356.1 hypothetical protein [Sinorhizobium meliloti]RVO72014.1 hypothetical protein CN087_00635 [Sinorhizobium meliloti]RVP10545.1 hypothetical protein CN085_26510 [Sinorhizobium meliloti]
MGSERSPEDHFQGGAQVRSGSFEPLIAPIADDHLRAKGAVRHEPCARLVARMFTFCASKIA